MFLQNIILEFLKKLTIFGLVTGQNNWNIRMNDFPEPSSSPHPPGVQDRVNFQKYTPWRTRTDFMDCS